MFCVKNPVFCTKSENINEKLLAKSCKIKKIFTFEVENVKIS